MITIASWLRLILLLVCRLFGIVTGLCKRKVVLHLAAIALIAFVLGLVDFVAPKVVRLIAKQTAAAEIPSAAKGKSEAPGAPAAGPARNQAAPAGAPAAAAPRVDAAPAASPPAGAKRAQVAGSNPESAPAAEPRADESSPADAAAAASGGKTSKPAAPAHEEKGPKSWLTPWNVLSVWAFGLVVWWVVSSRRQLVIGAFEDYSNKQSGIDAGGFGALVATELAGLSNLFREFEEGQEIQSDSAVSKPAGALFQTGDTSDFLEKTVSAESKFKLGFVEIPVGAILGLLGRMAQGPHLTGQIHFDAGKRRVTARLVGTLGNRVWNIDDTPLRMEGDKPVWRPVVEVANELACRLFAELAMDPPVPWRALAQFAEGVLAYRRSLRTPRARAVNVREAERHLIEAVGEDPGFDLALYNLGVVYWGQEKYGAADRAFARAVEVNNLRHSTYHALAMIHQRLAQEAFNRDQDEAAKLHLSRALDLCVEGLRLASTSDEKARILSLKAVVHWWRAWRMGSLGSGFVQERRDFDLAMRRAIRRAWWSLCRTELGVGVSLAEKPAARLRTRTLAERCIETRADITCEYAGVTERELQRLRRKRLATSSGGPARNLAQLHNLRRALELQRGIRAAWSRILVGAAMRMFRLGLALQELRGSKEEIPFLVARRRALRLAAADLRTCCRLTPGSAPVHIKLGTVLLKRRQYAAATAALETAVRLAPTSADGWAPLALAYAHRGNPGQVEEAKNRALEKVNPSSGRHRESMEALVDAMGVLQGIYEEVRALAADSAPLPPDAPPGPRRRRLRRWRRRLVRRLAGCGRQGRRPAKDLLDELLARPGELRDRMQQCERTARRARHLVRWVMAVAKLADMKEKGVRPLMTLYRRRRELEHYWEVGETGCRLARLYRDLGRLPEAEAQLQETIQVLQESLPGEIQRRGLYSDLAAILRRQGRDRNTDALEKANEGVDLDPVSAYEREELGWVYWQLSELAAAQAAWEQALLLAPETPNLQFNLGLVYYQQADDLKDKAARLARLKEAAEYLKTASEGGASEESRNDARYFLSRVYSELNRPLDARRELRALSHRNYCPLAVAMDLADTHLSNDDWTEAERAFSRSAMDIDELIRSAAKGVDEVVETPRGAEDHVLGTASAYCRLGIAFSLAQREIRLDDALAEIGKARAALRGIAREDLKADWTAQCAFHEGDILLRLGRIDEAIERLETALCTHTRPNRYCTLATALVRKAALTAEPIAKARLERRATRYYEVAQSLDMNGELESEITKGLAQLRPARATA